MRTLRLKLKWVWVGLTILILLSFPVIKAHLPKEKLSFQQNNVALLGYDLVSYFTEEAPRKGNSQFASTYNNIQYYFESEANKRLFVQDPEKFLPQYGAWCATAIAKGVRVDPIPTNYVIREGKLYLFFEYMGINPKKKWLNNPDKYRPRADLAWQRLQSQHSNEKL